MVEIIQPGAYGWSRMVLHCSASGSGRSRVGSVYVCLAAKEALLQKHHIMVYCSMLGVSTVQAADHAAMVIVARAEF